MSRTSRILLLLIVFIGGISSLGTEIAASRLIAPFFGTSLFVWANVIGFTLLYLTIGYYLGGRLADRYPRQELLYQLTAVAAVLIAFMPFVSRPVLHYSQEAFASYSLGVFWGSLLVVMLLLAIPITLLGCVSPFAIRLSLEDGDVKQSGSVAGQLYAISTVGSLLGAFLPTLVLIPNIGTRNTFLAFSFALLVVSLVALGRRKIFMVALLVVPIGLFFMPQVTIKPAESGVIIEETESAYNYIRVIELEDTTRLLELNEGQATHSIYHPEILLTGGPWDYYLVAPYFAPDVEPADLQKVLMIGLGAGTVPKQMSQIYGPIDIVGVEIDPRIVDIGREFFNMNEPNLEVVAQDGRYFLMTDDRKYDLIGTDAYQQPYIPFQMTTKEYFQHVRDRLTPNGVAVINVGRTTTDFRLVHTIAGTMKSVFPNVYIIDIPGTINSIVVATNQASTPQDFVENAQPLLASQEIDSRLRTVLSVTSSHYRELTDIETQVFTDNLAPVEQLIHTMILDIAQSE
jgi:spermidine synthase